MGLLVLLIAVGLAASSVLCTHITDLSQCAYNNHDVIASLQRVQVTGLLKSFSDVVCPFWPNGPGSSSGPDIAQHSTAQHDMAWHSIADTALCNLMLCQVINLSRCFEFCLAATHLPLPVILIRSVPGPKQVEGQCHIC